MYKLILEVKKESKSTLLGKKMKAFIVDQQFIVEYLLTNEGDIPFPGGKFFVSIHWPDGHILGTPYTIPSLIPGETKLAEPKSEWGVQSRGFGLFILGEAKDDIGNSIVLYNKDGKPVPTKVAFNSVLGKEADEFYQRWALIVTIFSTLIIATEKLIQLALWLISLDC